MKRLRRLSGVLVVLLALCSCNFFERTDPDTVLQNGTTTPVPVVGLNGILSISAGKLHTCAVRNDGTAWCWGANDVGQLGNASVTAAMSNVPVRVDTLTSVTAVSAGDDVSCAIAGTNNQVYCWGRNDYGQLGQNNLTPQTTFGPLPVQMGGSQPLAGATSITARMGRSCAFTTELMCWGSYISQQAVPPTTTTPATAKVVAASAPTLVASSVSIILGGAWSGIQEISNFPDDICARTGNSTIVCLGETSNQGATSVAGGVSMGCYVQAIDGTRVNCFNSGPLATSDLNFSTLTAPTLGATVQFSEPIKKVASGYNHVCALGNTSGAIWCWGKNQDGEAGIGNINGPIYMAQVGPVQNFLTGIDVSTGNSHTCAVASNLSAYCWGDNSRGQLGAGF